MATGGAVAASRGMEPVVSGANMEASGDGATRVAVCCADVVCDG